MREAKQLPERLLIAIGGNATHPEDIEGTSAEQAAIAEHTAKSLLPLTRLDNQLVLTHGNGPVVGKILMRQVLTRDRVAPMPLDICVAHSQGGIAYLLMQAIENSLHEANIKRNCAVLLTRVEVDPKDPAFENPSKPIGAFYDEQQAQTISEELGWPMKEDSGRGWRHVVASPIPKRICDVEWVETLARDGTIVIAGGGGGIPVVSSGNGVRSGVKAVIDKDMTSAFMANHLNIPVMMILTAVDQVVLDYGRANEKPIDEITVSILRKHQEAGQFPEGSMGPKIRAAIQFIEGGGERVIICRVEDALTALEGRAGTHIVAEHEH